MTVQLNVKVWRGRLSIGACLSVYLAVNLVVCAAAVAPLHAAEGARRSADGLPDVRLSLSNRVPSCVSPSRLHAFLAARNPNLAPHYAQLAEHYAVYGEKLAVRWDIAFFQMMVETANLTFRRPDGRLGDVQPQDNNFAGIGAIGDGRPGEVFATEIQGVRAHLEHVLHYAGVLLPAPVAERTRKVQKWRVLESWHKGFRQPITFADVARRWAPHAPAYLESIERLAHDFEARFCRSDQVRDVVAERRPARIGELAWRFEKRDGLPGTAGVTPPTGTPDFSSSRISLGVGRTPPAVALPPLPDFNKDRRPLMPIAVARESSERRVVPTDRTWKTAARGSSAAAAPPSSSAVAKPTISRDDQVRQLISDRKVLLRTHVGAVVPIVFDGNGHMQGEAGSLAFFLGSSRDNGKWWVDKGKLCQKWRNWLDRETHCIRMTERGGTIYWRADDGKSGTARVVSR